MLPDILDEGVRMMSLVDCATLCVSPGCPGLVYEEERELCQPLRQLPCLPADLLASGGQAATQETVLLLTLIAIN